MTTVVEPPEDRFCDLVMKGGITSGVVYPKAIALLSRQYRFKSIGGTSAGAIAAVVTAAAEFNRRTKGSRSGFDLLDRLPEKLQEQVPGTKNRKLLSLFQPQPATRRLFSVLIESLNSGGTFKRILAVLRGLLKAYWPTALGSVVLASVVAFFGSGVLGTVLTLVVTLCVFIGFWVYRDLTRHVVSNNYGMCNGMTAESGHEALTPWLHDCIQAAAGLPVDQDPLTFGMLWDAPGFPPPWLKLPRGTSIRSIDLQMFSTNLGHGRPYVFPLPEPTAGSTHFRDRERFFFRQDELEHYLPPRVLDWMVRHGKEYRVEGHRRDIDPPNEAAVGLLELPEPKDLPVLLAARMSLSFPLLFSAVPLWAIDFDAPAGKRKFRRCLFSDGGISSNFPMHLFDGLVPLWPTFGIDLEPKIEDRDNMVYLPKQYTHGYGERWNLFDEAQKPASRFGGFLSALVSAMQNWNDNTLARMPGVRDRIARVRLNETEGGMNLNMESETIERVAARGQQAAAELIDRFAAQSPAEPQTQGWDEQRWVRLCVLLKMIEARSPGIANALDPACRHVTSYKDLIDRAGNPSEPPAGYESSLTPEQQQALREVLEALGKLAETISEPSCKTDFRPIPNPELRVRPPL